MPTIDSHSKRLSIYQLMANLIEGVDADLSNARIILNLVLNSNAAPLISKESLKTKNLELAAYF